MPLVPQSLPSSLPFSSVLVVRLHIYRAPLVALSLSIHPHIHGIPRSTTHHHTHTLARTSSARLSTLDFRFRTVRSTSSDSVARSNGRTLSLCGRARISCIITCSTLVVIHIHRCSLSYTRANLCNVSNYCEHTFGRTATRTIEVSISGLPFPGGSSAFWLTPYVRRQSRNASGAASLLGR